MTIYHTQNKYCLGGNHVTWWIIKTMVDAGWSVVQSGSGTGGIYAASNVFDMTQTPKQNSLKDANNQGAGSEPWGHAYCWVVLEDPSANRQFAIMRDSSNTDAGDDEWYFGYSPGGLFGSGQTAGVDWDATTLPAATDQQDLKGTPTSWSAIFPIGGSACLVHVAADDTPSPEGEYGVFAAVFTGGNTMTATFFIDDLRNAPVGHPHPLSILVTSSNDVLTVGSLGGTTSPVYPQTMQDYGGGSEAWGNTRYCLLYFSNSPRIPSDGGRGVDGKQRAFPAIVGLDGSEGYMGTSRWVYWCSMPLGYPATANSRKDVFINSCVIKDLMDGTAYSRTI